MSIHPAVIAIHGGAGTIARSALSRAQERSYLDALDFVLAGGQQILAKGGSALDAAGNLAAATSTGGMTNKRVGRVGDTPLVGAGCYANNATVAVSCTGSGEMFMRTLAAYDISALIEYRRLSLDEACRIVIMEKLPAIDGRGGLIAVDRHGKVCMPFNTEGMYRGSAHAGGPRQSAIHG